MRIHMKRQIKGQRLYLEYGKHCKYMITRAHRAQYIIEPMENSMHELEADSRQ